MSLHVFVIEFKPTNGYYMYLYYCYSLRIIEGKVMLRIDCVSQFEQNRISLNISFME